MRFLNDVGDFHQAVATIPSCIFVAYRTRARGRPRVEVAERGRVIHITFLAGDNGVDRHNRIQVAWVIFKVNPNGVRIIAFVFQVADGNGDLTILCNLAGCQ